MSNPVKDIDESRYGKLIAPNTVRFERLLPGPIERVWAYITEGDKRQTWLGTGTVANHVGGIFETSWENSKLGSKPGQPPEKYKKYSGVHTNQHRVTKYEPPRLLAFTWDEKSGAQSSEVQYELTPQGDKVLLTVTHMRLPERKDLVNVSSGWHTHLNLLSAVLYGQDSGSFWENFARIDGVYEERHPK